MMISLKSRVNDCKPPMTAAAITMTIQKPIPPSLPATAKPTVAFTTPSNYAARLSALLVLKGFNPLRCPTLVVEPTKQTLSSLRPYLSSQSLESFSAIAFTSRTAITAFALASVDLDEPPLLPEGDDFTIAALGKDSELFDNEFLGKLCLNVGRIRVLVPPIATPSALVESMGVGRGRRVLCPVPNVVGLEEPPVVSSFLRELEMKGWVPVRVDAYETRWEGPECAKEVVRRSKEGRLDAIVFTSTAEVEGFLKSLKEFEWDWGMLRMKFPGMVVAAHGPVTAAGAELLGAKVDVVSSNFESFGGVVDALDMQFRLRNLE